jgi:hypothetical protein
LIMSMTISMMALVHIDDCPHLAARRREDSACVPPDKAEKIKRQRSALIHATEDETDNKRPRVARSSGLVRFAPPMEGDARSAGSVGGSSAHSIALSGSQSSFAQSSRPSMNANERSGDVPSPLTQAEPRLQMLESAAARYMAINQRLVTLESALLGPHALEQLRPAQCSPCLELSVSPCAVLTRLKTLEERLSMLEDAVDRNRVLSSLAAKSS